MKCHCNEIETLRVENDLLRQEMAEREHYNYKRLLREQGEDFGETIAELDKAEAKLAKIEQLVSFWERHPMELDHYSRVPAESLRVILDA